MGIFREIPPTAGWPIYSRDFFSLFKREKEASCLQEDFKNYLGVDYARITNSGTAALYLILEALKSISPKKTVVISSYICPLVPLAIKRAGLKVEVCDINSANFDFNLTDLESICFNNPDILAIVPAHLAGIPLDLDALEKIAAKFAIFIIEDCAQALGAIYKGKKIGTIGDFAFFSLARGKGLTIYEGGVIVANRKEYRQVIDESLKCLLKNDFLSEGLKILELFGYWLFYRPELFWFVFRLPQIFWNMQGETLRAQAEYFNMDFAIHKVSLLRRKIGHANFYRIDEEINRQGHKAQFYIDKFKNIRGIRIIQEPQNSRATYPYLTLLFDDAEKRKKAVDLFKKLGLGVFQIYPLAITNYEYLKDIVPARDCPNAVYLAEREITLSTSAFLTEKDLGFIAKQIIGLFSSAAHCRRIKQNSH